MLTIETISQLQRHDLAPLTVVTGGDTGQYLYLKDRLLKQLNYDPADLSFSYFDLSETDYEEVALDLESLSLFAEEKIVILDYFQDITTAKKQYLDEKALKRFEAYLDQPVPMTSVLIFAPGKLDGKRRLVKRLKQQAQVFEAEPLKPSAFKQYFQKEAKAFGLRFKANSFDLLLAKSNMDFGQMLQQIAFLASYQKEGLVTRELIETALPKTLQDNIFELMQLILDRRVDAARQLISELALQGEDAVKIVAVLLGQFRLLTQIKSLLHLGRTESQVLDDLEDYLGRRPNPYQIKYAVKDSQRLSLGFLKTSLSLLIETDYQLKIGTYEKAYLLDLLLLKLMSEKR